LTALFLALGASLAWGVADFVGPLWGRTWGALRVMLWGQVAGVAALGVAVLARGEGPRSWLVFYAVPAALAGTLGLYAYYRGMAVGAMTVIAPIAGASAVIPVVFGIATGDHPSTTQIAGIACAIVGVVLASVEHSSGRARMAAGAGLAVLAAIGFGFYFPPMHKAGSADFWCASLVFRTTALLVIGAVVAARRPALHLPRKAALVVVGVGLGDTLGNVLYAAASGHGLVSLTSVLASLYPVVTVLLAAWFLGERLAPVQWLGTTLTLTGVVLIAI
jgi:drug/metabolite transporter (DMT)-like permease